MSAITLAQKFTRRLIGSVWKPVEIEEMFEACMAAERCRIRENLRDGYPPGIPDDEKLMSLNDAMKAVRSKRYASKAKVKSRG